MMSERLQLLWLFVLAAPVACVAWTVTHEEVFAEVHDWCVRKSRKGSSLIVRKFFYLFTCEYCFSHYVALAVVWITDYRLLLPDWRGALVGWLAMVWVANVYTSLFGIGKLIFGETLTGVILLGVAAFCFWWIARSFRMTGSAGAGSRGASTA